MVIPTYTWDWPLGVQKVDPINLVFRGTRVQEVENQLRTGGWGPTSIHWPELCPDDPPKHIEDSDYMLGDLWKRMHIRLWDLGGQIVANAHAEIGSFIKGHQVLSYEGAKKRVEGVFGASPWIVEADKHDLGNADTYKYHNGKASEIRR